MLSDGLHAQVEVPPYWARKAGLTGFVSVLTVQFNPLHFSRLYAWLLCAVYTRRRFRE